LQEGLIINFDVSVEMPYCPKRGAEQKEKTKCGPSCRTLADVFGGREELKEATNRSDNETVENIKGQLDSLFIAAFNRFDTGFRAEGGNCDIVPPPSAGRLHKTLILTDVTTADEKDKNKKYVVQRLSLTPFDLEAVEHMFHLLEIAQEQAESKGAFDRGGVLEGWIRVKYFSLKGGKTKEISGRQVGQKILYEYDERGNPLRAWRVMEFVEGKIYERLAEIGKDEEDEQLRRQYQLKAAMLFGEAIAKFVVLMNFVPKDAQFMDTLPGFHDTRGYVDEVNDLLAGKKVPVRPGKDTPKAKMVDGLLDGKYQDGKYTARVKRMVEIFRGTRPLANAFNGLPANLQRAVCHGDLKLNNVIWATDEMGNPDHVRCFIDLDTIGVYTALDDFGDAARSMINILGEDIWREGKTLTDIVLDTEVFEKLMEGYLTGINKLFGIFSQGEQQATADQWNVGDLKVYLHRAVALYFFQLGTRFFKAFISELAERASGDNQRHFVYFLRQSDADLEDKNLRLAEVQYTSLARFLKEFREELKLGELGIKLDDITEPLGW